MGKSGGVSSHSPRTVTSTSSTSSATATSSSSSASKPAKAAKEEAPPQAPLAPEKKEARKKEKELSGVMRKASFNHGVKEQEAKRGTGKVPAQSQSVTQAQDVKGVGKPAAPGATVPVKVNVLAHVPSGESLKNIGDAVPARLDFFDKMCAKASAGIPPGAPGPGEKKMNVMVAPEWLFAKRSDPTSAYTAKDMQDITEGLQKISKKYPDMLIVPGSVSWEIPDKAKPGQTIMYNSTPIVQDGKVVHMYHKRNEGGETGGKLDKWGMSKQHHPEIRDKVESFNTAFFEHKGVKFSMEMCADQADGSARREYATKFPDGKGSDIHILISEGSKLQPNMTPVKNGGLVVHVDGSAGGSSKVGTISRPDITLSQWMDTRPTVTAAFSDSSDVRGKAFGPESQQEQMRLFTGLSVQVPKKDDD